MKIELAHDILAKKIYEAASAEDKMLAKIRNFISNRYAYYKDAQVLIDKAGLDYIEPFLGKITLGPKELDFINKSQRSVKSKQILWNGFLFLVSFILFIAGIEAGIAYRASFRIQAKAQATLKNLKSEKKKREISEQRAMDLLNKTSTASTGELTDEAVIKQLLIQYDTLNQIQTNTLQQRNLAQSSTLSNLSETALNDNNPKYAVQLAVKAWELNPNNNQALEILEELSDSKESLKDLSEEELKIRIKKARKKYKIGKLKNKDMKAIFAKENVIGQNYSKDSDNHGKKAPVPLQKVVQSAKVEQIEQETYVAEPSLSQQIQQQEATVAIPEPQFEVVNKPRIIQQFDCAAIKADRFRWIPLLSARRADLFFKYKDGSLLLMMEPARIKGSFLPDFYKLGFYNEAGKMEQAELLRNPNSKEQIVYKVPLSQQNKSFLKKEKITSLSFSSRDGSQPLRVNLREHKQNYFLNFCKCML